MNSKHQFGGPPIDFNEMARTAVRQVREIIAAEPTSPRGLYWSVMWEAARLGHKRLTMTFLYNSSGIYQPLPEDMVLVPKLAMAIYYERDLLDEPLPRHKADIVKLRRKKSGPPDCGAPTHPGELSSK